MINDTPDKLSHGGDYGADLLRARDEDRWLAANYAPDDLRRALIALYSFQSELRRIPGAVSEPPLGEIRLQWWRDALAEIIAGKTPRAHPVVEELAAVQILCASNLEDFEAVIDAMARPLYGEGFHDCDDLAGWLEKTEGAVDALAAAIMTEDKAILRAATRAGAAFAMAREGAALAPALGEDTPAKARSLWKEARSGLRGAGAPVTPAILHLSLTPSYLKRGEKPFPLAKRMRLFTVMAFGGF